ncbi:HAD-IA family hydrolase [Aestuariicella hydrocarbonica]|uniref:phosphoglycolate phosphatase n=1 Tax=Pseudomaricurvus hydrocarbonicus TaxID=1470433 RepID=A0A9E5MLN2_9GAMM|nr:HAD-IA family hydrolase [Aestuariicella hydrocarbonica]NHO64235.1 HAD-IA family hydrolase [Aestuariicella hydrocarbonica]
MSEKLSFPKLILFDWHGTLVNTLDAMYQAVEVLLDQLEDLDLVPSMSREMETRNIDDEKLLRYVRVFRHLHPKILAERRISRTDIFDVLFGDDEQAKNTAHQAYNENYRQFFGKVKPFQAGIYEYLCCLKASGIQLGIATNRSREFLDKELERVDGGRWQSLFEVILCGNETGHYKPAAGMLIEAMARVGIKNHEDVWYVGDSQSDMLTARRAAVPSVFYNGALWDEAWFKGAFVDHQMHYEPNAIVDDFDQLLDLFETLGALQQRPSRQPPREPPEPHIEPDWHPSVAQLRPPSLILFDWHATLVDTLDAMYHAVDDMLAEFEELELMQRLVTEDNAKSPEDMKLVTHVRQYKQLHPKIKADRKISRTDIFEVLFGEDDAAKRVAHGHFTRHYRKYYGTALPFESRVRYVLQGLLDIGMPVGVITNRDREFFIAELANVNGEDWSGFFQVSICGDDTEKRKPHTDQLQKAVDMFDMPLAEDVWYVGDSTTDTIAAKTAGVTSVFFNGAQWDQPWLNTIFPGSARYPHKPDVVVNDFSEFWALVLACRHKKQGFGR